MLEAIILRAVQSVTHFAKEHEAEFLKTVQTAWEERYAQSLAAEKQELATATHRLAELDKSRELIVSCQVGLRGYLAERILKQNGFRVRNLSGGYLTWKYMHSEIPAPAPRRPASPTPAVSASAAPAQSVAAVLDVRALACPGPIVRLKNEMDQLSPGSALRLLAATSFAPDLEAWIRTGGHELVTLEQSAPGTLLATLQNRTLHPVAVSGAETLPPWQLHQCTITRK